MATQNQLKSFKHIEPFNIENSESLLSSTTGSDKPQPTLNSTVGRVGVILANTFTMVVVDHGGKAIDKRVSFGVEHLVILVI